MHWVWWAGRCSELQQAVAGGRMQSGGAGFLQGEAVPLVFL